MPLHPMVEVQADAVEDDVASGPREHPAADVFFVDGVECGQRDLATLDGQPGRHQRRGAKVVAVATPLLVRVAHDVVTDRARQLVDVVDQVEVPPGAHGGVVGFDELPRRQLRLCTLQHLTPHGFQGSVDPLALVFFVDQLVAVRQPGHELA